MQLARVLGSVVATHKDEQLAGQRLLIVQPIAPGGEPLGEPLIATDAAGAGAGEVVLFVVGKEASFANLPGQPPTDAGIVGIVDQVVVEHRR
jgi:ethanolamine utilization protein EutN